MNNTKITPDTIFGKKVNKNTYIAVEGRNDGFGSQFLARLGAMCFALYHGLTFVNIPFKKFGNGVNAKKMEVLISIKNNTLNINDPLLKKVKTVVFGNGKSFSQFILPVLCRESEEPVLIKAINFHTFTRLDADKYVNHKARDVLRSHYYSYPKPKLPFYNNNCLNIAVHIRRGDVSQSRHAKRYIGIGSYLKTMNDIRDRFKNKKIQFHIFSQGHISQFKRINHTDVMFHLDTDLAVTFHAMVEAPVFIVGPSGLSLGAGWLNNNGIIYQMPYWHHKISDWIICDKTIK